MKVSQFIEPALALVTPAEQGEAREARPTDSPDTHRIGICCSGGGIRSASYCLGALQVLRDEHVLQDTEYVSAVSGGAYIASAFAIAAARSDSDTLPPFAPGSVEEEHLRNHSSYMAPDAAGKALLLLRIVGGALRHLVILAAAVVTVFWPASLLYAALSDQLAGDDEGLVLNGLGWWMLVAATPLLPGLFLTNWLSDGQRRLLWVERAAWLMVLAAGLLAIMLVLIPQGVLAARATSGVPLSGWTEMLGGTNDSENASGLIGLIGGSAVVAAIAGALSTFVSQRRKVMLKLAAFLAGPLVVLTVILAVVNQGTTQSFDAAFVLPWLVAVIFIVAVWRWMDLTESSLHNFYRRRLSSAFYKPHYGETADGTAEELTWIDLAKTEAADARPFPRLLVCAAANVTRSGETPPGRGAMPFVFSSHDVGVPGYQATLAGSQWAALTVPQAVAMSGAAVSPLMGKKTIRAVRFLMALMNIRLGVWLQNPRLGDRAPHGTPRLPMLIKEMLGLARTDDDYVYVTDGGHFDNLGLVELLRRGCTTVFCLDGGGDPPGVFRALGEAVALSRSELQVDVEVDPTPITPAGDSGLAQQGFALGTLRFRASPDGAELPNDPSGRIVYCRAAVTQDAPWDVRDFAQRDRRFPFHSTMDQLFTDEKFESYRALGAHTAHAAIAEWRRQSLRDKVIEVLQDRARARACVSYRDLVSLVRQELTAVELPTLRPLLDEISTNEAAAGRPRLVLIVQDADLQDPDTKAGLDAVYQYWEPLPVADIIARA